MPSMAKVRRVEITLSELAADCVVVRVEGVGEATLVIASAVAPLLEGESWLPVPGGWVEVIVAPLASVVTAVDSAGEVLDGVTLS